MATVTHPLIRHIRRLAVGSTLDLPDADLLARFAARGDEAAFEALVRRHGPLVLGVCRRVLGDWHAAEDAFQNVFALLAQRAGSLRQPEQLGPWLYGVAHRTALKARAQAARRGACERKAATTPAVEPPDELVWRDLRPVLDDALARLPQKYRTPVVLHYLLGVTVDEVARRLAVPRGTVATRLARAREQLRKGLARRGVTLSAGALAAAVSAAGASAGVPAVLLASTARAAMVAAGQKVIPGVGFAIGAGPTQGGGKIMLTAKVKVAALVLLGLGVAVGGGARLWGLVAPAEAEGMAEGVTPKAGQRVASPEGDLILFLDGSTHFFREEYGAAADVFGRTTAQHPDSRLAPAATGLAVLSRRLGDGGATDPERAVAEGRAQIGAALGGPTTPADRQGEREMNTAEFYRRTGHAGSACFYYELVCCRYPGTAAAARAAEQLRELRPEAGAAPQAGRQAPARVGRITVNGNCETPDALILYQLALHPGQVLTYPALSAARRNLAALRRVKATVSVTEGTGVFRDVLVQVEEPQRGASRQPEKAGADATPILPPRRPGRRAGCDDPPDRAAILRALAPLPRGVPYVCDASREDLEVAVEKVADRIDAARFFPLIGRAQFHHQRYKYTLHYTEVTESAYPFPFASKRRRVETVYIDRDHLHLVASTPEVGPSMGDRSRSEVEPPRRPAAG